MDSVSRRSTAASAVRLTTGKPSMDTFAQVSLERRQKLQRRGEEEDEENDEETVRVLGEDPRLEAIRP